MSKNSSSNKEMQSLFHKNSVWFGLLMGLVLPVILFGLLWLLDQLVFGSFQVHLTRSEHYLYLLSTVANLIPMRNYFVKLKLEKTGLGLLIVTTVLILLYFYLYFNS